MNGLVQLKQIQIGDQVHNKEVIVGPATSGLVELMIVHRV